MTITIKAITYIQDKDSLKNTKSKESPDQGIDSIIGTSFSCSENILGSHVHENAEFSVGHTKPKAKAMAIKPNPGKDSLFIRAMARAPRDQSIGLLASQFDKCSLMIVLLSAVIFKSPANGSHDHQQRTIREMKAVCSFKRQQDA